MLRRFRRATGGPPAIWLALGIACFVGLWFTFLPAEASVTSDDGAYALHVSGLERGSWSIPHVLAEVDPEGSAYPYQNSFVSNDGFFPAPRHAVWVRTLGFGSDVAGLFGVRVLPAVGLCVAAGAAAAMAGLIHGRRAAWLAGLLAVASPLLFNGLQLWAHAAVAGAIGVAMLGALHILGGPLRAGWLLATLVGVCAASAWRADGLVWAAAVAAVLGIVGLRHRRYAVTAAGGVTGVAAIGSFLFASRYASSITGGEEIGAGASRATGSLAGRLEGVVHTFFSAGSANEAVALLVIAFMLAGYAVVKLRQRCAREASVLLAIAAIVWLARSVLHPDVMASGLLAAWPVALVTLARKRNDLRPAERHLAGIVVLASVGIAVMQYDDGGGLNWGGRFLAPAVTVLAVLLAGTISHLRIDPSARRVLPAVGALTAACLIGMLTFDASIRSRHADHVSAVSDVRIPIVTSSVPLPRLAWSTYPEVQWLHVPRDDSGSEDLEALVRLLQDGGIEEVALYGESQAVTERLAGESVEREDEPRIVAVPLPDDLP